VRSGTGGGSVTEMDFLPFVGRTITIRSRKLPGLITGRIEAIFAGALMIQADLGFYGVFAQDVTEILPG
jgi:hypothetical protein